MKKKEDTTEEPVKESKKDDKEEKDLRPKSKKKDLKEPWPVWLRKLIIQEC